MDNYLYATRDEKRVDSLRSHDDGAISEIGNLFEALDAVTSAFESLPKASHKNHDAAFRAAVKPIIETIEKVSDFHSSTIKNHIKAAVKFWGVDDLTIDEAPDKHQYGYGAIHKLFMELMDGELDRDYDA